MTQVYRFAGATFKITCAHELFEQMAQAYACAGGWDFEIEPERDGPAPEEGSDAFAPAQREALSIYRGVAEALPGAGAFAFHASAISVDGQAYLFAAPSGVGKSTHARLWRELLGARAVMINDDKPFLCVQKDGTALAFGSPWDGKHHLSSNLSAPVRAICLLERAPQNRVSRADKGELLPFLLRQTYRPRDPKRLSQTLSLWNALKADLYRLECNMEKDAARVAARALGVPAVE